MSDFITKEQQNARASHFARKRLAYLTEQYRKTGDKKWVWMAYTEGFDVDYVPGQDDGEGPTGQRN